MTEFIKYRPYCDQSIESGTIDYSDNESIPALYPNWNILSDLATQAVTSEAYNNAIAKLTAIVAYLESINYQITAADLNAKFPGLAYVYIYNDNYYNYYGLNSFRLIYLEIYDSKVGDIDVCIITDTNKEFIDQLTIPTTTPPSATQYTLDPTSLKTVYNTKLNKTYEVHPYTNTGNTFNETGYKKFIFAANDNCIPAFLFLNENATIYNYILLNPPSIFNSSYAPTAKLNKIFDNRYSNYTNEYPNKQTYINPGGSNITCEYSDLSNIEGLTLTNYLKRVYTYSDNLENNSWYNSWYLFGKHIHANNSILCNQFFKDNYKISDITTATIPTNINDRNNIYNTYIMMAYDLDTSLFTNYTNGSKIIKDDYTVFVYSTTDSKLCIGLIDNEAKEQVVPDNENFIEVTDNNYTYKILENEYLLGQQAMADVLTILGDLSIDVATYNNNIFLYSFGDRLFGAVGALKTAFVALDFTKIYLYVNGTSGITQDLISFENLGFNPGSITSLNILSDNVANHKKPLMGNNIIINTIVNQTLIPYPLNSSNCSHTVLAYKTLLP